MTLRLEHAAIVSVTSFLGACLIILRRVHENRIMGVPGDHSSDAYWPFNAIWEYLHGIVIKISALFYDFFVPPLRRFLINITSGLHKMTYNASRKFLQISDLVKGKGTIKKNSGTTSLFLRDIAEYKKNINEK